MRTTRRRVALGLLVSVGSLMPSCGYLADRGLDFLDQYRLAVGVGSVGGVRARSLGLWDTGLMFGIKPKAAALGWKYGEPLYFNENDPRFDADQAEIIKTTNVWNLDYTKGTYFSGRNSIAILPALLTWVDATPTDHEWHVPDEGDEFEQYHWIWSAEGFANNRFAQIHAFDVEFEIGLFGYFDSGYSPGELLDFLLGIATIDLAKDDNRL